VPQLAVADRSTQEDLDEIEDWTDRAARRMYEGAGLGPKDVDVFNPYDGYAPPSLTLPRLRGREGWGRGLPVARRQTRRCLRVLRGRYQGRGPAPVLLERRQFGERAHPHGHVHRQHRAAPWHGRRTAGQGSGRDRAGGIHHAKQWRLDHVRQIPELTACDTGDHRLAAPSWLTGSRTGASIRRHDAIWSWAASLKPAWPLPEPQWRQARHGSGAGLLPAPEPSCLGCDRGSCGQR
jgi:hypothetical protein